MCDEMYHVSIDDKEECGEIVAALGLPRLECPGVRASLGITQDHDQPPAIQQSERSPWPVLSN